MSACGDPPTMPVEQHAVHVVAATVGFLSLGLLWLTMLWGTTLRVGWGLTRVRHQTLYGVHQTTMLLGLTLGLVHGLAQLAVPGGPVHLVDEWLPFANGSDPLGIGCGVAPAAGRAGRRPAARPAGDGERGPDPVRAVRLLRARGAGDLPAARRRPPHLPAVGTGPPG